MAHGQNLAIKSNTRGKEYYSKRGFTSVANCAMYPVSSRAGTNRLTKRLTMKSERQQVRQWIKKSGFLE